VSTNHEFRISELVIGIGFGLLAGLLWASRAGEDTRKEVRRRTNARVGFLNQQAERLRGGADKFVATAKQWIRGYGDSMQSETELQKAYQDKGQNI
jgi:gas vesicle protein